MRWSSSTSAQIRNDEAQIEYARRSSAITNIRAPISGRLGIRQIDQGNYVRAGDTTTIVTVTQLQPISVDLHPCRGRRRPDPAQPRPGRRCRSSRSTGRQYDRARHGDDHAGRQPGRSGQRHDQAEGDLSQQGAQALAGQFCQRADHRGYAEDAVTAPATAVRHGPRGDFVWIAKADDTAAFRPVTVGQIFDGRALIDTASPRRARRHRRLLPARERRPHRRSKTRHRPPRRSPPRSRAPSRALTEVRHVRALHPPADRDDADDRRGRAAWACSATAELPIAPLPSVDFPTIQVVTRYPGASATSSRPRSPRRWSIISARSPG